MTDDKRRRLAAWVKFGLGLGAALLLGPVVFLVVKGLAGLVAAGALVLVVVNFAPVLAMKLANWKLKAVKAEARANPVETLQNVYRERQEALSRFSASITRFASQVATFGDRIDGFRKAYPGDAEKYDRQLDQARDLLAVRRAKLKRAKEELGAFAIEIDRVNANWLMALAAADMNKEANLTEGDPLEKLKVGTAIDSVRLSMNTAFAELQAAVDEAALSMEGPALVPELVAATPQKGRLT